MIASVGSEVAIQAYVRLLTAQGRAEPVIEDRRAALRRLVAVTGVELDDQTPSTIEQFVGELSPQRRGHVTSHLRLFYNWAVPEGYAPLNPTPPRNLRKAAPLPFTPQESAVVDAYRRHLQYRGLADATVNERVLTLARLRRVCPIMEATPPIIEAYLERFSIETGSRAAAFAALQAFYKWAAAERRLVSNPMIDLDTPPRPKRTAHPIGEADLAEALLHAPGPVRPMLLLAGWAGLRAGEIARLRAEHLLLNAPHPVVVVLDGKGAVDGVIPISPWLETELRQCRLHPDGWLFPKRLAPDEHRPAHSVSHASRNWFAKLGIHASLHNARHRFGTQTFLATGDLYLTQMLMRHRKWTETSSYISISPFALVDAVSRLPTF